jgi:hypothetical protein
VAATTAILALVGLLLGTVAGGLGRTEAEGEALDGGAADVVDVGIGMV